MPNVATKALTLSLVITRPLTRPTRAPIARTATTPMTMRFGSFCMIADEYVAETLMR